MTTCTPHAMKQAFARMGVLLGTLIILVGCSTMKIEDFEGAEPKLVLEDYFDGRLRAWGLFQDRFGTVKRQFTVDIEGEVEGDTLRLVEDFRYDDGETERRVWTLRRVGEDRYVGTADGVVGEATGRIAGNAFNWNYVFDLPYGDGTMRVRFDDWMFLQDDGVLLNRAVVTKWGVEVGTAIISFRRMDDGMEETEGAETAFIADRVPRAAE